MTNFLGVLFWLVVAHVICDYPLQGPWLAAAKRAHLVEGKGGFWIIALSYHALIHAAAVLLVTGSAWLALAEFVTHWGIDRLKTTGKIDTLEDQVAHVGLKLIWAFIATWGVWT